MNIKNIKQLRKIQQIINFASLIPKNDDIAYRYLRLIELSKKLTAIDIHACNGTKYIEDSSYDVATKKVYQKIDEALKGTDLSFYHQTDPRGVALYIGKKGKIDHLNYNNHLAIY